MSIILDALRQSEHERQRSQGADYAVLPIGQAPGARIPWWALLTGLLLLNGLIAAWLLWRPATDTSATTPAPEPASVTVSETPVATAPAPVAQAPRPEPRPVADAPRRAFTRSAPQSTPAAGAPPDDVRPLSGEIGTTPAPPPAATTTPRVAPRPTAGRTAPRPVAGTAPSGGLPTADELRLGGNAAIPELRLDMHVYNSTPANRFVFINQQKYREGGTLPDGSRIDHITPEGVELNQRGTRYLLPAR